MNSFSMKFFPSIVGYSLLLILLLGSRDIDAGIGNFLTSVKDVTTGVARDAGNLLPTPQGLFETGKNVLAGYPFEFLSATINAVCSSAIATQAVKPKITPNITQMQFQLRTPCNTYQFPLLNPEKLWDSDEFDSDKNVVILATGWMTNINDTDIVDVLAKAYNCRGDVNFIVVDASNFIDTLYSWSAFNTEEVGKHIAKGLIQLTDNMSPDDIHLIGHSLGAHIVGAAARYFKETTGKCISRVTGLDPAKPCFNEGESLSGLLRGDAEFIDVIHTNPGVLGKRSPLGDVDFYPGGLDPLSGGCLTITCAHERAWYYYAETVYPENEHNFMAKRCSSLKKLRENKCPQKEYAMGYAVPRNIKGNYFLEVNSQEPFGIHGDKRRTALFSNCGLCKHKQDKSK